VTFKYFNVKNGLTTGNITLHAGNGNVTANYFSGNAALGNLTVTGNTSFTGSNVSLGSVNNLKIFGGSADYVLKTDGTGNLSWAVPSGGAGGGILAAYDSFTGNGVQTQYTLSVTPLNENQTFINIDGVFQLKDAYTLSGNIITFSSPPASGAVIDISSFLISNSTYSNVITNGSTSVDIATVNSNITMSVAGTANVAVVSTSGINVSGNISAGYVLGNGYYLTGIQGLGDYSNTNVAAYLPTYTGNISAGNINSSSNISAAYLLGNGYYLTGIQGLGDYSNANVANYLPTYTGNISASNVTVTGAFYPNFGLGNAGIIFPNNIGGGVNDSASIKYYVEDGAENTVLELRVTDNGTSPGDRIWLNAAGGTRVFNTLEADAFKGNGQALTQLTGANVQGQVGNALVAGTVYVNAQPNITSVGTLSNLTISGNVTSGNLNTTGNISASYVLGNGAFLTGLPESYSNTNVAAYLPTYTGNITAGNISTSSNITASYLFGNGSQLTGLPEQYSNANVAAYLPTYTGNITAGNLSTSSNITASYLFGNGSQLTGTVANANYAAYAGDVINASQGNITSLGTLNGLTATSTIDFTSASNVSLGTVANVHITGGSSGYYLKTDGTGNLSWDVAVSQAGGSNTQIQFNDSTVANGSPNFTFDKATNVLTLNGNLTTGNANLGNIATANYFSGDGGLLSNITPANINGQVANALIAGTVYTNAQPNITSLGTLSTLQVSGNTTLSNLLINNTIYFSSNANSNVTFGATTIAFSTFGNSNAIVLSGRTVTLSGNITSGNANLGNAAVANFFIGNGSRLSSITGANVTGQVPNALVASTVYTNAQPNITSLGTLSTLDVTGNLAACSWITAQYIQSYDNGSGTNFLVGDDTWIGDINSDGNVRISGFFDGTQGGIVFGNTDTKALYRVGSGPLTYDGNLRANWFAGNGSTLSSLTGANVTGQVGNALIAGTVYTNAQPNITSLGTLSTLTVSANLTSGNLRVLGNTTLANLSMTGNFSGNFLPLGNRVWSLGSPTQRWRDLWLANTTIYLGDLELSATANDLIVSGNVSSGNANLGNIAIANYFSGMFDTLSGNQPNITSLGTLSNISVLGDANIGGNVNIGGVVFANGNISTLGSLNALDINASGNAIISGNLTVSGNTVYANVETLVVEDPIIELGGGPNGAPLTTNDGKDRGTLLHYYTTQPVDAFMGWDNSNSEFGFGSNVTNTNEVITWNSYGNVRASWFIGNLDGDATRAGTVTVNAQPNITSLGTLSTLNIAGNLTSGNASLGNLASASYISGNGSLLSSITGANVTGQVGNALVAGTVYTNAQPNITSLGTLSSLDVTSNVSAGNVKTDNLLYSNGNPWNYTAGSNTQVQFNDGGNFAGSANFTFDKTTNTLSVTNIIGNGAGITYITGSNVSGQVGNALIAGTVYSNSQPNITSLGTLSSLNVTGNVTANYFVGNGSALTNITGGNVTGQVANALIAGTVYTNAQPNITSVGTLDGLTASGTIDFDQSTNVFLGNAGDVHITGGINGYYLRTDGTGNLTWDVAVTSAAGSNTEVQFNDNTVTNGSPNFTFNKSTNVLTVNGNITTGNANLGNLAVANYFSGNGSLLTSLTGANVTGQVANANYALYANYAYNVDGVNVAGQVSNALVAGTVYTNSQPNITSIGTLTSLTVSGNVSSGGNVTASYFIGNGSQLTGLPEQYSNANVAAYLPTYTGNISANYYTGNGSQLTDINGSNVTGQVANALIAGTVYTNAQPNITSVGTLTSLTVSGNVSSGANVTASYFIGNGSQLTGLPEQYGNSNVANYLPTYTGNITAGNISATGNVTASYFIGNGSQLTGLPEQYGNSNVANYLPTYTGNISANYYTGNGSQLTDINGSNVTGQVSNALIAGTVYVNAQPNITSVGTLSSLTITGNLTSGNANLGNLLVANYVTGTLTTDAQPNITSLGTLSGLTVNGTANLGSVSNVKITGGTNGYVLQTDGAGNLSWTAQSGGGGGNGVPGGSNTQVQFNDAGAFGGVSGFTFDKGTNNLTITGSLISAGANLGDISNVHITGGASNQYIKTDGTGNLSFATLGGYATVAVDTFTGNGVQTVFTLSQTPASINETLINYNGALLLRDSYSLSGANVTFDNPPASGSSIEVTIIDVLPPSPAEYVTRTYTGNGSGTNYTVTTGTTATGAIVSQDGVLQTPNVDYTVSGSTLTFTSAVANGVSIQIRELTVATGSGGNATVAQTVSNAAQPNITSTGILSSLTVSGNVDLTGANVSLGSVANIFVSGGTSGQAIVTDGSGNLSFSTVASYSYSAISANTNLVAATRYIVDTSSAALTLTLPSSATLGDEIGIIDGTGNASTNNITIARNGGNIQGAASDMTVSTNRAAFVLVYYNATQGWILTQV
jgi:hypothetical protein